MEFAFNFGIAPRLRDAIGWTIEGADETYRYGARLYNAAKPLTPAMRAEVFPNGVDGTVVITKSAQERGTCGLLIDIDVTRYFVGYSIPKGGWVIATVGLNELDVRALHAATMPNYSTHTLTVRAAGNKIELTVGDVKVETVTASPVKDCRIGVLVADCTADHGMKIATVDLKEAVVVAPEPDPDPEPDPGPDPDPDPNPDPEPDPEPEPEPDPDPEPEPEPDPTGAWTPVGPHDAVEPTHLDLLRGMRAVLLSGALRIDNAADGVPSVARTLAIAKNLAHWVGQGQTFEQRKLRAILIDPAVQLAAFDQDHVPTSAEAVNYATFLLDWVNIGEDQFGRERRVVCIEGAVQLAAFTKMTEGTPGTPDTVIAAASELLAFVELPEAEPEAEPTDGGDDQQDGGTEGSEDAGGELQAEEARAA